MSFKLKSLLLLAALGFGCSDGATLSNQKLSSELGYDEETKEIVVIFNRDLKGGEDLHVRLRSLAEGDTRESDNTLINYNL